MRRPERAAFFRWEKGHMKRIELIVCHDAGWDNEIYVEGWDNEIYVDIPDDLHAARDVDDIVVWICENAFNEIHKDSCYIGVYNWEPEEEE